MMATKPTLEEAQASVAAFIGTKGKRAPARTIGDSAWKKALTKVDARLGSGDWADATPRDFAALYALLHEGVYKVAPAELTPSARHQAALLAGGMLRREFDNNASEMAEFFRWAWTREEEREAWRVANNRAGGRIGVRLMFGGALLTDWRVDVARRAGKP